MIRVVVVDDHTLFREGLTSLVQRIEGFEAVGTAANGRDGIRLVEELEPDVVVMDVTMPDLNGIDATRRLIARDPDSKVLALSMHSDRQFVRQMLQAGARGYLLKDCAFEELKDAMHAVVAGDVFVSRALTGVLVRDMVAREREPRPLRPPGQELSAREREVLQLLAEGKTNKEVAEALSVGIKTAETHRKRLMNKLGLYTVADLTKFAVKEGLTLL